MVITTYEFVIYRFDHEKTSGFVSEHPQADDFENAQLRRLFCEILEGLDQLIVRRQF